MSYSIPSTSLDPLQSLLFQSYSRRLLLHTPVSAAGPSVSDRGPSEPGRPGGTFDANVVMVLAVLLCALICALGLNSIIRCALRCSAGFTFHSEPGQTARLATAGVRRKALRALPVLVYSPGLKLTGSGSECAICLSDLVPGDRVRVLPKCSHGFHVRCIDRWLMARPSCPTCRQCLFSTAQKSSECGELNRTGPVQSVIIVPLEPEGFIANYREGN